MFEVVPGESDADADADADATSPGVLAGAPKLRFHPATEIDETAVAQVQADLRRCILRAFVGRSLIESVDAKEMLAYQHSGFSVHADVRIEAHAPGVVPQGNAGGGGTELPQPEPVPVPPKRSPGSYL